MLIHHDKKRWARDKNAADRPVTLSKPAETINSALDLTLHNGLHRRGHSSSMSHSEVFLSKSANLLRAFTRLFGQYGLSCITIYAFLIVNIMIF